MTLARDRTQVLEYFVRRALLTTATTVSKAELRTLARLFVEAGSHAVRLRRATPAEAASAINFAREILATSRAELARTTKVGYAPVIVGGEWKAEQAALNAARARLLQIPNVVGVGLGARVRGRRTTSEQCLVVYVERKLAVDTLIAAGQPRLPKWVQLVGEVRVPVDVVEVGQLERFVDAGVTIARSGGGDIGTVGTFARDLESGGVVAITAMHVMQVGADFPPGPAVRVDAPVRPPGPARLGRLLRGTMRGVDAAKVSVEPPQQASGIIDGIGPVRGSRPLVHPGDVGTLVRMCGALSGPRFGQIVRPFSEMPGWGLDTVALVDIFAQHGDSGAAIVDNQDLVLGILVGQSDRASDIGEFGRLKVFSPIGSVLAALFCDI